MLTIDNIKYIRRMFEDEGLEEMILVRTLMSLPKLESISDVHK